MPNDNSKAADNPDNLNQTKFDRIMAAYSLVAERYKDALKQLADR